MTSIIGVNINSAMYRDLKFVGFAAASVLIYELASKALESNKPKRSKSEIIAGFKMSCDLVKYFAIPASVIAIAAEYLLPGSAYR